MVNKHNIIRFFEDGVHGGTFDSSGIFDDDCSWYGRSGSRVAGGLGLAISALWLSRLPVPCGLLRVALAARFLDGIHG